ncbi:putative heterokaryon incompatibility protein [Phaeoacremonium minimum UCRPA7]|uniref:Putative heterokaryon incompatibility protein n=1 Tax=Phaeoacremonium minimum (strain UCR-PA7) TaxID=1286976 RepID=R8BTL7_PHAM7|nr:putative heterokaryon incompatibility protein [Phaeoacremonium minimum UCRPA7]EOO02615.1 putative heterokaryon incompatibility protein [Phaeoacremonium minimum UCRPA7]
MIGNAPIRITQNLYDALQQLRKSDEDLALWVDAICINQHDDTEKATQIPLMAQIYSNASVVHIWLGKASAETCEVAPFLQDIGRKFITRKRELLEPGNDANLENQTIWADLMENPNSQKISLIWGLSWFTRKWVVQELAFAQKALMHCGTATMDWREFAASCFAVTSLSSDGRFRQAYEAKHGRQFRIPHPDGCLKILTLDDMVNDLKSVEESGTTKSLFRCVADAWPFDCKEDKDRVLSILGIFNHGRPQKFEIGPRVRTEELYKRFAYHCYEFGDSTDKLDMLSYAGLSHRPRSQAAMNLPSWIPDWRLKFDTGMDILRGFTAGHAMSAMMELFPDQDQMLVRGVIVDRVKANIPPVGIFNRAYQVDHQAQWYAELERLFTSAFGDYTMESKVPYIAGGLAWEALMKTLILDRKDNELINYPVRDLASGQPTINDTDPDSSAPFHQHFHGMRSLLLGTLEDQAGSADRAQAETSGQSWRTNNDLEYKARAEANCLNRSFFVGERGFIGLGPEDMVPGDIICLPAGTSVPYVLRPEDANLSMFWHAEGNIRCVLGRVQLPDGCLRSFIKREESPRYQLVGECYTEGIMHGEAWNMGALPAWEEFVLF